METTPPPAIDYEGMPLNLPYLGMETPLLSPRGTVLHFLNLPYLGMETRSPSRLLALRGALNLPYLGMETGISKC